MLNKETLIGTCQSLLNEKLKVVQKNIFRIQEDANNETKSAMGDKYETGRALLQNEKDKFLLQKDQIMTDQMALSKISITDSPIVNFGAIVKTNKGIYFLSISLGQIKINDQMIFALSPSSPMGQLLLNKNVGETVTFRGNSFLIESIH